MDVAQRSGNPQNGLPWQMETKTKTSPESPGDVILTHAQILRRPLLTVASWNPLATCAPLGVSVSCVLSFLLGGGHPYVDLGVKCQMRLEE